MSPAPELEPFIEELRSTTLRRSSSVPLYMQVAAELERAIRVNPPTVGHPLPPEHELAEVTGVSRPTLRQAVAHLGERGILRTVRGVGTFVAHQSLTRPLRMGSLWEDLLERGLQPMTEVLAYEIIDLDDVDAVELNAELGQPALFVNRLRSAGAEPVALITNLLPLPDRTPPSREVLTKQGLYAAFGEHYGVRAVSGNQRLSARLANSREARLLQVQLPSALLVSDRLAFREDGVGFDKSTTLYLDTATVSVNSLGRELMR